MVQFGSATITDTIINNNAGLDDLYSGGGVYVSRGPVFLYDVVVEDNEAGYGGGVSVQLNDGNLAQILYSTVSGNTARKQLGFGAGVYYNTGSGGGSLLLHSVTLSGNHADWGGGLSVNAAGGYALVVNSTISDNIGGRSGGGIRNDSSVG